MQILADPKQYSDKEQLYIGVRTKEGRVVSDEELKELPNVYHGHPLENEWMLRSANFERLKRYLQRMFGNKPINILDVGCGNGWMTHRLNQQGYNITGVDLNIAELQQAERTFGSSDSLQWVYADIMQDDLSTVYDIIILGASCQYFEDIVALTERLKYFLKPCGEIHLFDSVFYSKNDIAAAAARSLEYYTDLGFPEMSSHYFHHAVEDMQQAGYKKLYPRFFNKRTPLQWWCYK